MLADPLLESPGRSSGDGGSEKAETTETRWASVCPTGPAIFICDLALWYALVCIPVTGNMFYAGVGSLLVAMVIWRFATAGSAATTSGQNVPYTCGYVSAKGRELFLVGTLHISPKAAADVREVIRTVGADLAMIELDHERLDRLRDAGRQQAREAKAEDLQPVALQGLEDSETVTVLAQRATWNAERCSEVVSGQVVFDEDNAHGLSSSCRSFDGKLALVLRGGPEPDDFAPFAVKAHAAAKAGAAALLVINSSDTLPALRIGVGALAAECRVALAARSCGFPRIPALLLPKSEGERLRERCSAFKGDPATGTCGVHAEFEILPDSYPRRTLRRRLCQTCAIIFSGIGILYGVIQCFAVEVGGEFLAADAEASVQGIPCDCIDVDMNRFWARLGAAALPTPRNLLHALTSWLAFPRILFQVLFPPRGNLDVLGGAVLHTASFPLRTWVAFGLAGYASSFALAGCLEAVSVASERGAETTGAVSRESRDTVQQWIMLLVQLFLMPQIYAGVAAVRDEAMYQKIVAARHERQATKLVVVVGAGHANGILRRARERGF